MTEKSRTIQWILVSLAIVILLVAAIAINEIYQGNPTEQITSGISTDNGDLKINWNIYNTYEIELTETYTITGSGIYHLTGNLTDGAIIINTNSEGVVKLILDIITVFTIIILLKSIDYKQNSAR